MALLACVGVDEEDFREVLAVGGRFGEGSGLRLAVAGSHRPEPTRSAPGS
jgi:hypothetical protein